MRLDYDPETMARQIQDVRARFLDTRGQVKVVPADQWQSVDSLTRAFFCHSLGVYGLPTCELVAFLREIIGEREALEIGAGTLELGAHLDIHLTDSHLQSGAFMNIWYALQGQAATKPSERVEKLDALSAVEKYRPQVVLASWVTRLFHVGKDLEEAAQASCFGVDEEAVVDSVESYVHIGHINSHGRKTVLSRPHLRIRAPWLLSRSRRTHGNLIYIFGREATSAHRAKWQGWERKHGLCVEDFLDGAHPAAIREPSFFSHRVHNSLFR